MKIAAGLATTALLTALLSSCGATLVIDEVDRGIDRPAGLVINHRTPYQGRFSIPSMGAAGPIDLHGIDARSVLQVDLERFPFADAKLVLELDEHQVARKVGVTSADGAADAASSLKAIVDARSQIVDDED